MRFLERARPSPDRYARSQIVLHWLVVGLLVAQFATSGAIVRTHTIHMLGQRQDPTDLVLHNVHNKAGLAIVLLMVIRLMARVWFGAPSPVPGIRGLGTGLARLVHGAFYAVLIAEGTTGAIASYLWWPISAVHVILFKVLLGLLAIHLGAALWHAIVLRDGTLRRVSPARLFD